MASLTRDEMRAVIGRGESVFVRTREGVLRVVTSEEHLPSEGDLAAADRLMAERAGQATGDDTSALVKAAEDRQKAANAELQAKIAELQAKLDASQPKPPAPAPVTPPPAPAPAVKVAPLPEPKAEAKK